MRIIDLNCDLGEGFGQYSLGRDQEIMKYISSANIACGFHAGDPSTMNKTVKLALENNVSIGAHPGLPDLQGFGRRSMAITPMEAYEMVLYQTGALNAIVTANGGTLRHIKPHGALYNMAAANRQLAEAITEAVYDLNPDIILFGLAGSELIQAGRKIGLKTANEVFADRTYQSDGSLTSRLEPNALILDEKKAIFQTVRMVEEGKVQSVHGVDIEIQADTICLHGDAPNALDFAQEINEAFAKKNIRVQAIM